MKEQSANAVVSSDLPRLGPAQGGWQEFLARNTFVPHPALRNAHAQTIAGTLIRRRFSQAVTLAARRLFCTTPGVRVLAHCSWQADKQSAPTLILVHGMEGSTESRYMLGTADKAIRAGFNAIRLNVRNCGGTEHLTSTLYHAGLTDDLRAIVAELAEQDGLRSIFIAGFSLGGNVVLKLAGEYGSSPPDQLAGAIGISPSIDLGLCADAIEQRSNVVYSARFVWSLRSRMRRKAALFPNTFDISRLGGIWTIREYDETYVAPHWGFEDAADYYQRASALRVIDRLTIPTLIIHAKDDPFIPFSQIEHPAVRENSNVFVVAPDRGGHVGFISNDGRGEERFWAERMAIDFVKRRTMA